MAVNIEMASKGETIFNKDTPSDVWDDSALIKAYDSAISCMKVKMFGSDDAVVSRKKKRPKRRHKKKLNNASATSATDEQPSSSTKWHVGQECDAFFSEDGLLYPAIIVSINPAKNTCVVRYVEYGNEEQKPLDELRPTYELYNPPGDTSEDDDVSKADSSLDVMSVTSGDQTPSHSRCQSSRSSHRGHRRSIPPPNPWAFPMAPPPPFNGMQMPMHGMPFALPMMPASMPAPQFPLPHQMFKPPAFPRVPPPPMTVDSSDASDNEALYSMLISWYMSGYHTGYYQGKQEKKSVRQSKNSKHSHAPRDHSTDHE